MFQATGTMLRHNLVVYRSDWPGDGQPIRFDDEPWQNYVPIRLPQTVCITESLPAGAAARLLNQSHIYSDLVLPLAERQRRLFEAIHGQHTIEEILARVVNRGGQFRHHERAHSFFEQLWR